MLLTFQIRIIYKHSKRSIIQTTTKRYMSQKSLKGKTKAFLDHPAGPKTIFFWAPAVKWSIVLAGITDIITRHPSAISMPQTLSLVVSGSIWSRYSMVIIPKNWLLFSVNFFVALTQSLQLIRVYIYNRQEAVKKTGT